MTYLIYARKYRPQNFDELIAQEHITETLKNAIRTDHVAQAFLFTGPRGVGKTSLARILAKALNCENGPTVTPCNECKNCKEITNSSSVDVIEIDGASNTGVDDVRRLQAELMYPTQTSNNKIYIIDEVHMLSKNAFNALLKTLEEPPPNVKFIFATTEPHKVLATITSRCQRYDFHRISIDEITKHLKEIISHENIECEDSAIFLVAKKADGSLRDALSLMDQIVSIGKTKISKEDVLQVFGIVNIDFFHTLTQNIIDSNNKAIINNFHKIIAEGNDINEIILGFIEYLRNILMLKIGIIPEEVHADDLKELKQFRTYFTEEDLLYAITILMDSKEKLKSFSHPILLFETTLLKLTNLSSLIQIEKLQEKINPTEFSVSLQTQAKERQTNYYKPSSHSSEKKTTPELKPEKPEPEKSAKPEKNISLAEIKTRWKDFLRKIEESYPAKTLYLGQIQFKTIHKNHLFCLANSKIAKESLEGFSVKLKKLLKDFFGVTLLIQFGVAEKVTQDYIHAPTINDIRKHSPKLAEIINKIDGYIVGQKRFE